MYTGPTETDCLKLTELILFFFLINLFHGRFLIVVIAIKRRKIFHIIIICVIIVIVQTKTELDKSVNTRGEGSRLIETESTGEEGGIVKQPDQIADGLVRLVSISLLTEGVDD